MANPFEKRATEYLRDNEAFLAFVTPEPLALFFEKPAKEGRLYDRLVIIVGTPGSGKTTLARLFQYPTLQSLLRNKAQSAYKPLLDTLTKCGAIQNEKPLIVGCRLPLEAEYREFWEFPYPDELKFGLMTALFQARAVLAWIRNLTQGGNKIESIEVIPRNDADAALSLIGGANIQSILERARQIELAVYKISAALIPPDISELDTDAVTAYRPFDVIDLFRAKDGERILDFRPLVIFDDAHSLHRSQFSELQRWLMRRELRVSRWILTRIDALNPADVFNESKNSIVRNEGSTLKSSRDITKIWLQTIDDRTGQRRAFRKTAKDMASRYLRQMEVFNSRNLHSLGDMLATNPDSVPSNKMVKLNQQVDSAQKKYGITVERRQVMETEIDRYLANAGGEESGEDIRLAMLSIFIDRYAKRIPQRGLFEEADDIEPSRPLTADSGVADGARIQLLHKYDRPYFFGIDTLCDASSENAEQFLQLAARFVGQIETRLVRGKPSTLSSGIQNTLLRQRAEEIIRGWDFPQHQLVRQLVETISIECLEKSLEPNAPLGGGASAVGIPQEEFDEIPTKHPELASVIQFGVAYNAFSLVPNYGTKKKFWCLIELGGVVLIKQGLTLRRGGFLERKVEDLIRYLGET